MTTLDLEDFSSETRFEDSNPITLPEAFRVGLHLQYLKNAAEERHPIGTHVDDKIAGTLLDCRQILETITLETSIRNQLIQFGDMLSEEYGSDERISEEDANELKQKSITWQRVFREDLQREKRVPVADTGLLDVNGLLENPEKLFSTLVWDWLDEGPREDIREACKTLVVDCSTSSVFLSLRAVEHCLGEWYMSEMGEQIESESWGGVLKQLIEEFLGENDSNDMLEQLGELPPVLSNLYYLKEKRNEVNHPEESPGSQEARRTLLIIASTITEIHNEVVDTQVLDYRGVELEFPEDTKGEEKIFRIMEALEEQTNDGGVDEDKVYEYAYQIGISESSVDEYIHSLMMSGRVYEPSTGVVKTI